MLQNKVNDIYSDFISYRTYSRWLDDLGRRESWVESVNRYGDYLYDRIPVDLIENYKEAIDLITKKQVMPSMRLLWSAGPACDENNLSAFNCSYMAMDSKSKFGNMLYVLMHGVGVGYSVERQYVGQLPTIPEQFQKIGGPFLIADSKLGWKQAYDYCIKMLFDGYIPEFDYSLIRPKGARLKTFGGRACLTGDTIVYKDRKKARGYNEVTIKQLFDMKHKLGKWGHVPSHFKDIKLRALNEETGRLYRNNLLDVVENGVTSVYEILTENGYRIKATDNHRFMNELGEWDYVSNFGVGDNIAVNGSPEKRTGCCVDCGKPIARRAQRCKSCFDKTQLKENCLHTTARQRKECRDYASDNTECEDCKVSNTRLIVHHIDKDPTNNDWSNLKVLCETCHRFIHAKEDTFGDPYSHKYMSYDKIISIEYAGEDTVYDLCMEAPNHNFVANGFISHNSGPEPLEELLDYTKRTVVAAAGKKLNSLEVHDICCMIANCVVVGGVRRSACISFSNLSDQRMKHAKDGQFWIEHHYRSMANNTVAYTEKPGCGMFMEEWLNLMRSGSGERGIANIAALQAKGKAFGRMNTEHLRANPCFEAILNDEELCNLTEVVTTSKDTVETIMVKIRAAVLLGLVQSTLTNFPNMPESWTKNAEEERLLGVSLTGTCDCPLLKKTDDKTKGLLRELKEFAHSCAFEMADVMGISRPKQITLTKPSGTVSQLVNSSSGIHPRYADYYIRRVRVTAKDPIATLLKNAGVGYSPEVNQPVDNPSSLVFDFPMKSPRGSVNRHMWTAIEQLEYWKMFNECWADGNPSITIYVSDDEWVEVGAWVYKNWDSVCGLSFLPKDNGVYKLAPYEEIDSDEYHDRLRMWKNIDIDFGVELSRLEIEDGTEGAKTLACVGGSCEL